MTLYYVTILEEIDEKNLPYNLKGIMSRSIQIDEPFCPYFDQFSDNNNLN